MASARILALCDAVQAAITTYWQGLTGGMGPGAVVERKYVFDLNADAQSELPRPAGRRVFVTPVETAHAGAMTRGEDDDTHTVLVSVDEWFDGAGEPDAAWTDERVAFTEGLWLHLRNARPEPPTVDGYWPETAPAVSWYDPELLRFRGEYYAWFEIGWRSPASPT